MLWGFVPPREGSFPTLLTGVRSKVGAWNAAYRGLQARDLQDSWVVPESQIL